MDHHYWEPMYPTELFLKGEFSDVDKATSTGDNPKTNAFLPLITLIRYSTFIYMYQVHTLAQLR